MSGLIDARTDPESRLDTDPVCGTSVYRSEAREHDLVITFAEREYIFCAPGCMKTFLRAPAAYAVAGRDTP